MQQGSAAPMRPFTLGRRIYRGVFFALLVGFVGAAMSVIPGLFVQSVFSGNVQRCESLAEQDLAAGETRTSCLEEAADDPTWLPQAIIAGGGIVGLLGGFGYGFVSPASAGSKGSPQQRPYLPF